MINLLTILLIFEYSSNQIRNYTQQLVKDTDNLLKNLNFKDRHLKIQRDRLVDEFTSALTAFQVNYLFKLFEIFIQFLFSFKALQKKTFDIEKNAIRNARASAFQLPKPPGSSNNTGSQNNTLLFEDTFVNNQATQLQMQEDVNLQALEEQERAIRELEVFNFI